MASRGRGIRKPTALLVVASMVAGAGMAAQQRQPPDNPPANPAPSPDKEASGPRARPPGGLRLPPAGSGKDAPEKAADPLGGPRQNDLPAEVRQAAPGELPIHYAFRLKAYDGQPFSARYYPAKAGAEAPVVLLVHENGPGRSGRDFEDPVAELKKQGLAPYLQLEGYAVLVLDLRGHGANPRRSLNDQQWRALAYDLQAAYHFLIDRHNRRELNLAKFGLVALGDGGSLAAWWATQPGAAVSIQGRRADLAAIALISPVPESRGIRLAPAIASLSPRIPILLLAGEGDTPSANLIKESQEVVERQRLGKTALVEGRQHGSNLLRFTPGATKPLLAFLESTLKARNDEWEPRFNLDPVTYSDIQLVDPNAPPAPSPLPKAEPKNDSPTQEPPDSST